MTVNTESNWAESASLDNLEKRSIIFNERRCNVHFRACNGFDGDFERGAAIRGPGPRKNLELNINADNRVLAAA